MVVWCVTVVAGCLLKKTHHQSSKLGMLDNFASPQFDNLQPNMQKKKCLFYDNLGPGVHSRTPCIILYSLIKQYFEFDHWLNNDNVKG